MKREFVMTSVFDELWKELDLSDDDLRNLQNYMMQNPFKSDIIKETGGARKLRYPFSDKGE